MKRIYLLIICLISIEASYAFDSDSLLMVKDPNKVQRGALAPNWKATDRFVDVGMLRYQVMTDTVKKEDFALLYQADTAMYGKVEIPQYVNPTEGPALEVRGVGRFAFYLGHVSEVVLPMNVEYIGDCAFHRCYNLERLKIPEKVHTIGDYAFTYCGIDSLCLPENLVNLGELQLSGAIDYPNHYPKLKYIYLGKNITDLRPHKEWAYSNVTYLHFCLLYLEEFEVSPDNKVFYSIDGVLFRKPTHNMYFYPMGKKDGVYMMPDDTHDIEQDYCIYGNKSVQIVKLSEGIDSLTHNPIYCCKNLRTIVLPANLKYIATKLCPYCSAIKAIYATNPTPCEAKQNFLVSSVYTTATLYVPKGCLEAYRNDSVWGLFQNIQEYDTIDYRLETSSVAELNSTKDRVLVEGNRIRIISDDEAAIASVYDMQGRVIFTGRSKDFYINRKGIFILRYKNKSYKCLIR